MSFLLAFSLSLCFEQAQARCIDARYEHCIGDEKDFCFFSSEECKEAAMAGCLSYEAELCRFGTDSKKCDPKEAKKP